MSPTRGDVIGSPAFEDRRRTVRLERRRRKRRVAVALVTVAALGCGGWWIAHSSLFGIGSVTVDGNALLTDPQVVAASGIRLGENVLGVDLDEVAARVEALAAVEDATVERAGALGIRITIVERAPAVVVRVGEERWFLDRDGHAVGRPVGETDLLPVIETAWSRPGPPPLAPAAVAAVLTFWDQAPPRIRARIDGFERMDSPSLVFRYRGVRIVFGSAQRVGEKLDAMIMVLRRARDEGKTPQQIDVRSPEHPAARIA